MWKLPFCAGCGILTEGHGECSNCNHALDAPDGVIKGTFTATDAKKLLDLAALDYQGAEDQGG